MPTTNQLVRKGRKRPSKTSKSAALRGNPQLRGTVTRAYVIKPRKPNSALRKVVRVRLSNGEELTASIPGEGHNLAEHHSVLVIGGNRPDLGGVSYKVIRGALDLSAPFSVNQKPGDKRKQSRSKYGTKRT